MAIQSRDWENPERSPEVRQILRDRLAQRVADFNREKANRPSPKGNALDKITEQLNAQLAKTVNDIVAEKLGPTIDEVEQAAAAGATLTATTESTCFDEVSWQDGLVFARFTSGHEYEQPMPLADFIDWMEAASLGTYFNETLGQSYFAPKDDKGR